MPFSVKQLLIDLHTAIYDVETFVAGKSRTDYQNDLLLRRAVEREFEIIGEILRRIEQTSPLHFAEVRDGRAIINFRNIIAHGYDVIEDDIVFDAVTKDLLALKEDLARMEQL